MSDSVRTRFAPSPTGYLHIGGVRTALFNWLFARQHGGKFVLRIDDTDRERNVEEALQPILDGFRWLGIDWDEGPESGGDLGPYYQSQRQERYRAAAERLLEKGLAYRDYATPEELESEREAARKAGTRFLYSRAWAGDTPERQAAFEAEGRPGVVRLKMPREGNCRFRDRVRGDMDLEWAREQDHVIQRADGSCLYHLASVVDDHEMRISHVIRAEEHLSNTPRQIFIAQGLGYELPEYAHLPVVAEPGSKNKLSKRKLERYLKNPDFARLNERGRTIASAIGLEVADDAFNPVIVDFYREIGFVPEAVVNYLLLLGWAYDDRKEDFTRQEMIELFSLERVKGSPASFDPAKLLAFQDRHMQALAPERRRAMVLPYLERVGWPLDAANDTGASIVDGILAAAGDRIKMAGDILDYGDFFAPDGALAFDTKAFDKRLGNRPESVELLRGFRERLEGIEPFRASELEQALKAFLDERGAKIGELIHALRVAVTGKAVGFGMFETLEILGRTSVAARIDRTLQRVSDPGAGGP